MKIDAASIFSLPASRDVGDGKPDPAASQPDAMSQAVSALTAAPPEVRRDELSHMVDQMNRTMKIFNHALQFRISDTGRVIITVFDASSGEVIRQIPPEALVEAFDHVDKVLGLLVDRKV